jgi:hypothetical protein
MTTAARVTCSFSVMSGCSVFEYVATAETARVMARAYGDDACTAARALVIREVAMSSWALKIFFSAVVELIRWR